MKCIVGDLLSYCRDLGYFGPDVHDIFLQQFLLIGDLLSVGWLVPVLLHLLVRNIQHRLQLVLGEDGTHTVTTRQAHAGRLKRVRISQTTKRDKTLSSFKERILASSSCRILSCSQSRLSFA